MKADEIRALADDKILAKIDAKGLAAEVAAIEDVFHKPFAMKALILLYKSQYLIGLIVPNLKSKNTASLQKLGAPGQYLSIKIEAVNPSVQSSRIFM